MNKTWKLTGGNIAVLIIAAIIIIVTVVTYIKKDQRNPSDTMPTGWEVQDHDEFMESKKDVPSDIEGMSQYDKYEMGLNYQDGSDSDYDGLTDKEEIEIYHTDPLKASTAGDLYTDGYKIKNGMDPFTPSEYNGEIIFEHNSCPEITLEADEPSDLYAVVEKCSDTYPLTDYNIDELYAGYTIYNYNGPVVINTDEIVSEDNLSDLQVWVSEGDFFISGVSQLNEAGFSMEGSQLSIEYDMDKMNTYNVFIGKGKKISVGGLLNLKNKTDNTVSDKTPEEGVAIITEYPLLQLITGHKTERMFYLEYSKLSSEEITDIYRNRLIENPSYKGDIKSSVPRGKKYMEVKLNFLRNYFPSCEWIVGDKSFLKTIPQFFFNYRVVTETINDDNSLISASVDENGRSGIDRDSNSNRHSDFDKYSDELPFQNFESNIGTTGNCAGISHLTSYLYNTGSFPASGSYNDIAWNLDADPENTTLTNKGLDDYKDSSFIDKNSGKSDNFIGTGLTAGEQEFVNMIGGGWSEANDRIDLEDYMKEYSIENDFTIIQKTMDYIDQGKIVDAYMLMKAGYGHAVNIYDYFYTDAGEIILRVYDSNIPQDSRKGVELNHAFCYIHVKEHIKINGESSFTYLYLPIKGDVSYMATSVHNLMKENALVIMDENWNVF